MKVYGFSPVLAPLLLITSTLGGQTSDTTPPVLRGFSFSPTTVNAASAPTTVTATISVSDDLSGVDQVAVTWYNPARSVWYGNTALIGGQSQWNGTITVTLPQFSQSGAWTPDLILGDKTGNVRRMSAADIAALGFPTTLTVGSAQSGQSDSTAPRLMSFSITPTTVDVSRGPATLNVHIVAQDDLSGFGSSSTGNGSIDIRHTSGSSPFGRGSLPQTSGTLLNPTFDFTLTVPQFSLNGSYPINLTLIDNAFNTARFTPSDLLRMGFPSAITVAPMPSIQLGSSVVSFVYQLGGNLPQPQILPISGSSVLSFTATTSGGSWLSLNTASATTPASLSVSVDPTGLGTGTYRGAITIDAPGAANSPQSVSVTLTVTAAALPPPSITTVANAASYANGAVSPGEIVYIGGSGFGPTVPESLKLDQLGNVATTLGGVRVLFSGVPAPLIYVSSGQINAVVPYEIDGAANPSVQVEFRGQTSRAFPLGLSPASPALFTSDGSGKGEGSFLNQNTSYNGKAHPAPKGSYIVLYLTGEGKTLPVGTTGKVTVLSATPPLTPQPVLPVSVVINDQPADVAFYGEAPGMVSGVMQLNVQVPVDALSGELSIKVSVGGTSTQSGVTVSVQ